jgi:hypothetical protein
MPEKLVERALQVWRAAERALESLDSATPEAATVRRAISEARSAYSSLSGESEITSELLDRSRQMIEEAEVALRGVTAHGDHPA